MKTFNKLIGIKNITLFHLNDSRAPLGSHLDRHESIGKGFIFKSSEGKKALRYLIITAKKYKIPIILETPTNEHRVTDMDILSEA